MAYSSTPPKPDDVFNQKVLYLCQTKGCGEQISEFPAAEKNPPPKKCKLCMNKSTKDEIEKEFDSLKNLAK